MFTIFGATGNTGSIVAQRLLAAGKPVRAVVRDAQKGAALKAKGAELAIGEIADAAFVARALAGAENAYLLLPPNMTSNDVLGHNRKITDSFVAALDAGKVPHAVLLSSIGSQKTSGNGPIAATGYAEVALQKSKSVLTFVRPAYFMENLLNNAQAMQAGVLPVFGGGESYPFAMTATRDIGDVAADALLAPPKQTEWIELRGPREYSMVDAAAIASEILGRKVTATVLPIEQMVPALTQHGISENMAGLMREMTEAFAHGLGFEGKGRTLHGKVELADVLRAALKR